MKRNYSYELDFNGDVFYCRAAVDSDTMNDIIDIYDENEDYVGSIDGSVGIPDITQMNGDADDRETYFYAVQRLEDAVEELLNS